MPKMMVDALGCAISCVYRHKSHVAGMTHRNKVGRDRRKIARKLKVGSQLILKADPDNLADQDAVLVYPANDLANDIGYLYSFTARSVARKMRGGATFSAEISEIDLSDSKYPTYRVYLYQLTQIKSREPKRLGGDYYRRSPSYGVPAYHAPRIIQLGSSSSEIVVPTLQRHSWWQRSFSKLRFLRYNCAVRDKTLQLLQPIMTSCAIIAIVFGLMVPRLVTDTSTRKAIIMVISIGGGGAYLFARRKYLS